MLSLMPQPSRTPDPQPVAAADAAPEVANDEAPTAVPPQKYVMVEHEDGRTKQSFPDPGVLARHKANGFEPVKD